MNRLLYSRVLVGVLALLFSVGVHAAPPPKPVEVLGAEFGLFSAGRKSEQLFEASETVPHRVGQRYGWVIELRTTIRSVSVREEYLLPLPSTAPKATEDVSSLVQVTPVQRRNQVSQRHLVPVDGKIFGEWEIGPAEPAGHRHLQVFVEDQLAGDFEFDVKR
jgi:hypothetical protein